MENQNQSTQTPQSPNQIPSIDNNSSKSKVVPLILVGVVGVLIAIGAYLLGTKQSQPVVQVPVQTTPIPSPIPVDETANWKTYTSNDGFRLMYPPTWSIHGGNKLVVIAPPVLTKENEPTGEIGIETTALVKSTIKTDADAKKEFKTFQDLCSLETPTSCDTKVSDDYRFEKEIRVGGNLAFQTHGGCCMDVGRHIFVYNKNNSYRITLYHLGPISGKLQNEDIFDQILSTFQFTN